MRFAFITGSIPGANGALYSHAAVYSTPKLGPVVNGSAKVIGEDIAKRQFTSEAKMLAFASAELNGGEPVSIVAAGDGCGVVIAAPAATEKPAKPAR